MPERHDMGRALIHEEKIRFLKKARLNPRWQNSRWAMILALNTTMRSCEIRGLRWRHVDFMARTAWERAKTLGETELTIMSSQRAKTSALTQTAEVLAVGLAFPEKGRWSAGVSLPRHPSPGGHRAGGISGEQPDDHGHRRPRLAEDAHPLPACKDGGQETRLGRAVRQATRPACRRGARGGLWHKPRHKFAFGSAGRFGSS